VELCTPGIIDPSLTIVQQQSSGNNSIGNSYAPEYIWFWWYLLPH